MDVEPTNPDAQKATNVIISLAVGLGIVLFLAAMWAVATDGQEDCRSVRHGHHHHDGSYGSDGIYPAPLPPLYGTFPDTGASMFPTPVQPEPYIAPEGGTLMGDPRLDWGYAVEVPDGFDPMSDPRLDWGYAVEVPNSFDPMGDPMTGVPEIAVDPADAFGGPREPNFLNDGSAVGQTCEATRVDPMTGDVLERVTFAC